MKAALSLLVLLFSMYGAQTRSTQNEVQTESQSSGAAATAAAAGEVSTTQDIYAELKELRDMVVGLSVTLRHTQDELKVLGAENAAQEVELASVKRKLATSEASIDNLKVENAAQETELTEVKTRLAATENEVANLEKEIKAAPKVAFSASPGNSGYIDSGTNDLNLVFSQVITNVGQAYSSVSGFFTAPVKGVYYFRFTVLDLLPTRYMHIQMHKNGQKLIYLQEYDTDRHNTYLSSGLTLQLERGDVVNLVLPAGNRLYDNGDNHCTFSGFLLFPL